MGIFVSKQILNAVIDNDVNTMRKIITPNNVNTSIDITNSTALHIAAKHGYIDIVDILIENNVDRFIKNISGKTALHIAILHGHLNVVNRLINNDNNNINDYINDYTSILNLAVLLGYYDIVNLLIEHGIDINKRNRFRETAIYMAANDGRLNIVQTLYNNGANLNIPDSKNISPIQIAYLNGHMNVVNFLLDKIDAKKEICLGHVEIVQLLINNGLDINELLGGAPPITLAAEQGYIDLVTFLLNNNADVNKTGNSRVTALHQAAQFGHLEIVKLLLEHGADKNIMSIHNVTPLDLAQRYGYIDVARLLINGIAETNDIMMTVFRKDNCSICLNEFGDGDQVYTYKCGHQLHKDCYNELTKAFADNTNKCPLKCI
jgi:ankyrin repeat protein